jgi:hypothetical protein
MARTRTAGIRIDSDGRRIIDKEHRGVGIYLRLGPISRVAANFVVGARSEVLRKVCGSAKLPPRTEEGGG